LKAIGVRCQQPRFRSFPDTWNLTPSPGTKRKDVRKILVLLLMLFLPGFLAAQEEEEGAAGKKSKPIPAAEKAKLSKLLPEPRQLSATAEEPRFYASDLYRYIDGGAEVYHMYDLVAMVHREYKPKDAEVTVDVYDMGNPLNAFGIYAAERSPDYRFVQLGAEGYIDENILNFLQGSFYVKLSAFSDKQKTESVLRAFADEISRRIGPGKLMPALLSLFPERGLVARSQKFLKKAPLGHEFLAPATAATYTLEGKQSTLLISSAVDAAQTGKRIGLLRQHFSKTGKVAAEPGLVPETYRGSNSYEGELLFFPCGRYTVALVNPPPDAGPFLNEVASKIKGP
jgi:hypothetical protein